MRRPRYSRVNIRAYASAIRITRVCARVTSAHSTRERVSIASIPRPLPPRKKVESLGTRLACPLHVNLVLAFEREFSSTRVYSREYPRVRVRVLACDSRATREGCQVARERHCTCSYSLGGGENSFMCSCLQLHAYVSTFRYMLHVHCVYSYGIDPKLKRLSAWWHHFLWLPSQPYPLLVNPH